LSRPDGAAATPPGADPFEVPSRKRRRSVMSKTVGDFLFSRLQQWGIRRVFGYLGDGINGIVSALGRAADAIEFVQVRHEEEAGFMACGHAKFIGEVGVCLASPSRCSTTAT
jgi:glyoxylate carboligase